MWFFHDLSPLQAHVFLYGQNKSKSFKGRRESETSGEMRKLTIKCSAKRTCRKWSFFCKGKNKLLHIYKNLSKYRFLDTWSPLSLWMETSQSLNHCSCCFFEAYFQSLLGWSGLFLPSCIERINFHCCYQNCLYLCSQDFLLISKGT